MVGDPASAVNAEAARLRANGVGAIVALGHLGATSGSLTSPAGPLIDFADQLTRVDAVIGDHTDFQVVAQRPNGILVTENRSKGLRFTRLRLVLDTNSKQVVYTTADFHKPWVIGITADPIIQARINDLNGQLGPILATVIGTSTRFIPRADACGHTQGRTCESLVGDVTADAMRVAANVEFAITNSGGAMPTATLTKLRMKLPSTSVFLMYGLTEAFRSTYLPPDQADVRPTSIGKAIPNAEIVVVRRRGQAQLRP